MATFRFKRGQLEELFGNDYDGLVNFELMLQEISDLGTAGLNITTADVPEDGNLYFTDERVDDRVSVLIQDGPGISWAYNDPANTLTPTVTLDPFTTDDLAEGSVNLYFTEGRVGDYLEANILTYGYESVSVSTTVTKTKTAFTGSTTGQTITLPSTTPAGREVEVFNTGSVEVTLSGSSVLGELYANESACFTSTGSDWVA